MRNTTKINLFEPTSAAIHPPAKARVFLVVEQEKLLDFIFANLLG